MRPIRTTSAFRLALLVLTSCSVYTEEPSVVPDGLTIIEGPSAEWQKPCVVPQGTTFAAKLDRRIGTGFSTAGQIFTARVSRPVAICGRLVVAQGAEVRGRVVDIETGDRPRLAILLLDVETLYGPKPASMAIRSAGSFVVGEEDWPFHAFVVQRPEAPPASEGPAADVDLPVGSELVIELSKPITILP
jgi:hypothetical protein